MIPPDSIAMFDLTINVPFTVKAQVLKPNQRVVVAGIAMTLTEVLITPSAARFKLYADSANGTDRWRPSGPTLKLADGRLFTYEPESRMDWSSTEDDNGRAFTLTQPLYGVSGDWTLSVGQVNTVEWATDRKSYTIDNRTGPWTFRFTIPPGK